jgi:hypothetical protein
MPNTGQLCVRSENLIRAVLFALCFLFSGAVVAQDLAGEWRIVECSAGSPPETVTMLFAADGTLRMTTTMPGSEPSTEAWRYELTKGELVITTRSGEITRHALEDTMGRIKVRAPFGFFVIERTPNHSLQPTGNGVPPLPVAELKTFGIRNADINKLFPLPSASSPAHEPMQYYGLLGDYIGGVWGTLFTAATVLGIFLTFLWSRRMDYRAKTYQVFAEMMRTHEEIVQSLRIGSRIGRDTFSSVLSEFYVIYKLTRNVVPDNSVWSIQNRVDIAYTCTFFGPHLASENILEDYGPDRIRQLFGAIHTERQAANSEKRQFGGHQLRLSHYFRNLFSAYTFIEGTKLSDDEKLALGKVLRSKLSNHEQAVLTLNIMSHLGAEWERTGLVEKYKPIKNLPSFFLTFDRSFIIKDRFPYINFEWETTAKETVKVHRFAFRRWSLVLLRRQPRRLAGRSSGPPSAAA